MSYLESLAEIQYRKETGHPKPRPTQDRGIDFRSRLEVRFSWYLDSLGEHWKYEPRVFGPKGRGYLPDFQILGAPRPTFIEVKPTLAEVAGAKAKMSVIWETHPNALLIVACQEGRRFFAAYRGGEWAFWQERWAA